jgi:hypothetical protein
MTTLTLTRRGLDRVGFVLSTACAVHCALLPLVAGMLPLLGLGFLATDAAEVGLLAGSAVIATWSLAGGCRHHRQPRPIVMMIMGFAAILAGRFAGADSELVEVAGVVAGALLIASAHLSNRRLCCVAEAKSAASPADGR